MTRRQEPMKQRFKRRHAYKYPDEIRFSDDTTEFGESGREVLRKMRNKPHSHDGGRKPRWRAERKRRRNERAGTFDIRE